MGKSKSSSQASTSTTQIDRRIGASDQASVIVAEGEGSSITLTDAGAFSRAAELVDETVATGFALASETTGSALALAENAVRDKETETLIRMGAIVAVVAFAAKAFVK